MRFIMYHSSFETLLTCKFEFFSDTGWANKNYHFSNPFRPFSEVKKNISTFIKKNFFHYNVSNSGNIRSYCTDWFSVNFFASFFSLFIDLTSPNDDYKFIFRSFKIITRYCSVQLTRRKRPSNPFQLNAKWTKPFKRRTLRLNRIKREREREIRLCDQNSRFTFGSGHRGRDAFAKCFPVQRLAAGFEISGIRSEN